MSVPVTNVSFSSIQTELGLTGQYSFDTFLGRKLASVGNTGQDTTSGTQIKLSNFKGHAYVPVTVSNTIQNLNLRTYASQTADNYALGKTWVSLTVNNGGIIGSSSTNSPSLRTGTFASGDLVEIAVNTGGYISGAGGKGGNGAGGKGGNGTAGGNGGDAVSLNYATTIINNGTIQGGGGGGGGGGGSASSNFVPFFGGPGGGGAGDVGGIGGIYTNDVVDNAKPGTLTSGGAAGDSTFQTAGTGGNGGNPGQPGQKGGDGGGLYGSGAGGAAGEAGYSINGYSNATYSGSGQLLGPTA